MQNAILSCTICFIKSTCIKHQPHANMSLITLFKTTQWLIQCHSNDNNKNNNIYDCKWRTAASANLLASKFCLEFSNRFLACLKSQLLLLSHVTLRLLLLFAAELDPRKMMAMWGLFDNCLEEFVELIRRIDHNPAGSDRRDRWMARKDRITEIKQRERERDR